MFLELLPRYKTNVEIQLSILGVLHNLSQYEPNCKILLQLRVLRVVSEFEKSPHLELREPAAKIITFVKSYQDQEELTKKAGIGFKTRKTNGTGVEPLNLDKTKQSSSTARSILSPRDVQTINNSKNNSSDASARGSKTHREGQHNRSLSTEATLSSERDGRKSEDQSRHHHDDRDKDKKHKSSKKKDSSSREGKERDKTSPGPSAERLEVSDHKSERRKSDRRKSEKRRSIDAGNRSKSPSGQGEPTNINNVNVNNMGTDAETRRHKHRSDRHKKEELSEKREDKMNNVNINNASSGEKINGSDKV
eukprot:TRINITY_DN5726_c0_g1_i1.p1 TRINITY_DN5726_c0_g1~~TRINITY_DN5726_c0_g1_i1.p1  ORF type:complete len:307 (-),score=92.80 TRINITY_DN5726_c0_g1_i1:57-977(-)